MQEQSAYPGKVFIGRILADVERKAAHYLFLSLIRSHRQSTETTFSALALLAGASGSRKESTGRRENQVSGIWGGSLPSSRRIIT